MRYRGGGGDQKHRTDSENPVKDLCSTGKNTFFASFFLLFVPFYVFHTKKSEKPILISVWGVQHPKLVKIHNKQTCFHFREP